MIYYIFEKSTGAFAGSGTPQIDNETHTFTTKPMLHDTELNDVVWNGKKWVATPYNVFA